MKRSQIPADPYNIIITGVGGQGNVMASRILSDMLVGRGFLITIGETFGASQRGGSVMSHIRVSAGKTWSPQIPRRRAHAVLALEPVEAIRVLAVYGNPDVVVLSNTRPVYPVGVITGEADYPSADDITASLQGLSARLRMIDATDQAIRLGNPILTNIVMLGAFVGLGILPVTPGDFESVLRRSVPAEKHDINLKAFAAGLKAVRSTGDP